MRGRLVLIDAGFHSFDGHQYNYMKSLVIEARSQGIACQVIANRHLKEDIKSEFGALAAFNFLGMEMIGDISENQSINYNYNFFHFNLRFAQGLLNACSQMPPLDAEAAVFFTTTNFRHTLGILHWLDLYRESDRPRVSMLFRDRDHMHDRSAPLHRLVLPILASPRLGVRFCTETPALSTYYGGLSGSKFDVIPVPIEPKRFKRPNELIASRPIRIVFLGQARLTKGFHLLPEICRQLRDANQDVTFTIQCQVGEFDQQHDQKIIAAASQLKKQTSDRVTLIESSIGYEADLQAFPSADVVLLPYSSQTYRDSASAIFVEALAAAKIVVLPADTWMA